MNPVITAPVPALAISFEGRSPTRLEDLAAHADVVEVIPDTFVAKYSDAVDARTFASLDEHAAHADVVYHGIGLSIGTASGWNDRYLQLLDRLCEVRAPRWHSEHLGFSIIDGHFLGAMLAMPATIESADLAAKRAETIRRRYGLDFLLEHVACPLTRPDSMSAAAFVNYVARNSGCGVILDLHNLECDEDNGALCIDEFLDELDLALVREIHVAGGTWLDGYHLDSHTELPTDSTLTRLDAVLPRCVNAELVVLELADDALASIERDHVVATLRAIRARTMEQAQQGIRGRATW